MSYIDAICQPVALIFHYPVRNPLPELPLSGEAEIRPATVTGTSTRALSKHAVRPEAFHEDVDARCRIRNAGFRRQVPPVTGTSRAGQVVSCVYAVIIHGHQWPVKDNHLVRSARWRGNAR
jgi:hypothetical protein